MSEGMTCYERDETLCEDGMCLRTGCRLHNKKWGELARLPKPETMLTYASILEKPQYWVDKAGRKFLLPTGEIIEAACAALRFCASVQQTPLPDHQSNDASHENGSSPQNLTTNLYPVRSS